MKTARDILAGKGTNIVSIGSNATVLDAALLMNDHKIGCMVVMDQGRIVGIFSERDVLVRVVGKRRDPATTKIAEVMTREVICSGPEAPLDELRSVFRNRRIRHLPVCEPDGKLLGLLSIGDLNMVESQLQETHIHYLEEYLQGRA
ncbi:MAG: CBS domain-containing protein [Phycisphaerales bacterium]|nr:CBS domain-containing protein [Phycisphaerales bacterium]